MEILEVTSFEYSQIISAPYHVFGSSAFNDLNKNKCSEVFYLLFKEGKYRLGIIGGIRDSAFYSPFSAPYGGFNFISESIRIQYIEEAIKTLSVWAGVKRLSSINITLPPTVYKNSYIAKQINCLWREGFIISDIDLNYSFDLESFNDKYIENISYNGRKNLKIALNSGLIFCKAKTDKEKELAYEIIRKNREYRGYPLHMSWMQVQETIVIISSDFFLVYNDTQIPIASAIVFHSTPTIVQIIYWGDIQGYSETKPMNFIAYKVFEYYKSIGKKVVDIGPSTENSAPNYGLCEFKESIGCSISNKLKFVNKIQ